MYESFERELHSTGSKAKYDEHAKRILAQKIVLAHILVNTVPEFAGLSPEQVVELIEGEPEVAGVPVCPGETNNPETRNKVSPPRIRSAESEEWVASAITGSNIESKVPYEGMITFDVRFFVWAPGKKEKMKIIVDAEIQQDFYPGYDIVTRGVFYAARLLSAQLDTEFDAKHYNDIKKVYSIWLCVDTPLRVQNTITYIHLEKEAICGPSVDLGRYDLMGVVIVGLSGELVSKDDGLRLHRFLGTIFSERLTAERKKEILASEYNIVMSDEMERRTEVMCDLSEGIERRGIKQGEYQTLYNLLKTGIISINQVVEQLGVSEEEFLVGLKELNIIDTNMN